MQKVIEAVLNYNDPIRSMVGSDLRPQYTVIDTMRSHSDNNYMYGVVRSRHLSGKTSKNDCSR